MKKLFVYQRLMLLFLLFAASSASGQINLTLEEDSSKAIPNDKNTFTAYAEYISVVYDISWTMPKNFVDLKTKTTWGPAFPGIMYRSVLQSKDENCRILYGEPFYVPNRKSLLPNWARQQLINEVNDACGAKKDKDGKMPHKPIFDFEKYVKVISGAEAIKMFNADTVYIAQIDLKKPYKTKYIYCTGIYLQKKGRPIMTFKCFFNQAGKQKEDEYLKLLYKNVKYRNNNWKYNKALRDKENKKYFKKTGENG